MQDYEKLGVFYLGREYDAASGNLTDHPILYDSKDLTTHAVCVGMTGSGKTGLCVALLEEAAIDGIPAICIDPKGDLANLALAFPDLQPADFVPWVDPAEAQRKDLPVDQYASEAAQTWRKGLADWGQAPDRIARFKNAADVAVYTPGSESGLPLSVLRSFAAPPRQVIDDTTALRDRVGTLVSSLLSLLGRDADPIQSREHVLLANILEQAWRRGVNLDMTGLIAAVQKPTFDKVGAFDLETFFPAKNRVELAMALNNLLASPGFAAWMRGEPLDAQRLLFTSEGKPRIAILSIAHLSDAERMFIVTLVLNEMISWMRNQPGTASLRAILYMDEIFGYFPPTANPPSKVPMLTLLKQARAFGLGCVLATQNPVDLDYKGLANAGTWFIGRLQTERDKLRVIDGLESALTGSGGYDRAAYDKLMSQLQQRVFLMRNVHEDQPLLFKSRWALSYLRGPLTSMEISRLMGSHKSEAQRGVNAAASTPAEMPEHAFPRPTLSGEITEYFLPPAGSSEGITYKPMVIGLAKLHFVDAKLALDEWRTLSYLAPLADAGDQVLWAEAKANPDLKARLEKEPRDGASFAPLPGPAMRAASYNAWSKALSSQLYESSRATVWVCDSLKLSSAPDESERDFRARLALKAREQRDAAVEELRRKYAPKFATLEDRERRASERVEREKSQLSQQKVGTALSVGASILRAFLGRRRISASAVDKAASAMRSADRIGRESQDVNRASEGLESVQERRRELQQQFDADCAAIDRGFDASSVILRKVQVAPRKSDIAIGEVALVWTPWRRGADGFPAPVFEVAVG
jgi:hypothetical protein